MTACSSCVCRIVVEVYRDCDEMKRARWRKAGNRHGEISLGLDWQRHLDTAGDVITGPLYQELVSKIGESGLKARSAEKRVVEEGDRWLVFDTTEDGKEGSKYLVKKYKDRLGVYQKKTFTVVPHCKYLRVSAVGGEWFGLVDPYLFVLNCEEPLRNVPAFEKYGVGEWTVIECCTREFETVLNQLSP